MQGPESLIGKFLGKYEIVRQIGRGGMGVVFEARQQSLQRGAAVKVLSRELAGDESFVKRFIREARAAAQLSHPNLVHIYDVDVQDGLYYIAMEYVRGASLADLVRKEGLLDPRRALEIIAQAADGLAEVHRQGIVHRDIKPQNIMVDASGRVKVMDFGLAKGGRPASKLTKTGARLGTPIYMSPEQIRGREVDARTDIYSLGVTLHEILSGTAPFKADSDISLMYQILETPFPRLDAEIQKSSPGVQRLIDGMVAKDAAARYPSAEAIADAARTVIAENAAPESVAGPTQRRMLHSFKPGLERLVRGIGGSLRGAVEKAAGPKCRKWALAAVGLALVACVLGAVFGVRFVVPQFVVPPSGGQARSVDLGGGVMLEMVWIPPGNFTTGSPSSEKDRSDDERQHQVTLTKGFWLGRYEVTQEQWERVMGSNPSVFKGAKNPVEQISWEDAQAFCQKAGNGLRLPTEAEWEYACRAGSSTAYCFGDSEAGLGTYAWYLENSGATTHPVGGKKPNAWGLYDMHGNVWEWCQDWFGDYPSGSVTDPTGSASGSYRVLRGGSWRDYPGRCRSANRSDDTPDHRNGPYGFRLVRTL